MTDGPAMIVHIGGRILTGSDVSRFWNKVAAANNDGCLLWTASCNARGYGQFRIREINSLAHRVAWVLAGRTLLIGHELDHLCRQRSCVSIDHLEQVTSLEHRYRSRERSDRCRRGHPWADQIPILHGFGRECRICRNTGKRRRWMEEKESK